MENPYTNPYKALVELGAPVDSHESDLYVLANPQTVATVKARGWYFTYFRSAIDGRQWIEIPFGFEPWWDRRL